MISKVRWFAPVICVLVSFSNHLVAQEMTPSSQKLVFATARVANLLEKEMMVALRTANNEPTQMLMSELEILNLAGEPMDMSIAAERMQEAVPVLVLQSETTLDDFYKSVLNPNLIVLRMKRADTTGEVADGDNPDAMKEKGWAKILILPPTKRLVGASIDSVDLPTTGKDQKVTIDGVECSVSAGFSSKLDANWIQIKGIPVGQYSVAVTVNSGNSQATKTDRIVVEKSAQAELKIEFDN